ncbi:MAG TPA: TolC family protein [Thermoanaerobaculia bacterium]|nr:TolC family protein [Thermoanaerobaculia bacterium]
MTFQKYIDLRRIAAVVALLFAGCSAFRPHVDHSIAPSPAPATPWNPPAAAVPPIEQLTQLTPPALPANVAPGTTVSLAQIIDVALSNNPDTRSAWLRARVAEAQLRSSESAYLPEIDGGVVASRQKSGNNGAQTGLGISIGLSWLLFDFGGREAAIEQARQTLIAAGFEHNQVIQDVVLRAEQAYYGYLDSKALLEAQDATLKERQIALESAEARHRAGVATIADVLQARTARSQAQLNRETIEGNLRTIEGLLATTMGLPATTRFDFGTLPLDIPTHKVAEEVDALLARAVTQRPELAAARAEALRANARIREVRAQGLPNIGVTSNIGETFASGGPVTPYSAAIALRVPIFTGGRIANDVRAAQLEAELARENVRSLQQQVDLEVWTSYFALQTAEQRLTTARELLSSAQQSADVASGRYRSGVGTILDLLTAEAALESARAQEVQARTDWFLAVAQLAHDTGSLAPQQGQ